MVTKAYRDYLKSDRWTRKRQQVFAHYGKQCYACRKRPKVLHVHHVTYARLGREAMSDLMPLCQDCHVAITRYHKRNRRKGLRKNTMYGVAFIRKFASRNIR